MFLATTGKLICVILQSLPNLFDPYQRIPIDFTLPQFFGHVPSANIKNDGLPKMGFCSVFGNSGIF